MADIYNYKFELTFFLHGVELNLYHSSKLDNNGELSQDVLDLCADVESYIGTMRCETCKKTSRQFLDWIMSGATTDDELADWCCKQYRDYYKREGRFLSTSVRHCGLGVLRDIYTCTDCRNEHASAAADCI